MAESPEIDAWTPPQQEQPASSTEPEFEVVELATGRLYFEGEPEVRLRASADDSVASYLIVITIMGDGDRAVGLTASVFRAATTQDRRGVISAAKDNVSRRVSSSRGEVVGQEARFIRKPSSLAALLVREMLNASKQVELASLEQSSDSKGR